MMLCNDLETIAWILLCEFINNLAFISGHKCTMEELPSFGQQGDSDPLDMWPHVSSEHECKNKCLPKIDCDAFTYVVKDKKCIVHKKIISPKKGDCCTYWAKTCPGKRGEESKYN